MNTDKNTQRHTATKAVSVSALLDPWVVEILRCPVTHAQLVDGVDAEGRAELHSTDRENPLAYPVRDGIPVLLESEARSLLS